MMDIRPTSEQALEYLWFGRQCLEHARRTGIPGARAIQDGRLLVVCKYTLHQATLITISQGDFAMHPRSGKVAKLPYYDSGMNLYTLAGVSGGGYAPSNDGFAQLAGGVPYPLRDNDHATFVISVDGEEVEVEWAEAGEENYGNIWWTSAGDNPTTLSWRGPPSVQFPLPSSYLIPGLTQDDGTGGSTVFGCYIYREGARIHGPQWFSDDEMATLIIGACYAADNAGTLWLVAITVTRRDSIYWLQVWRSGDAGKNWQLLNEFAGRRARTPAFISGDGRSFVYEGAMYALDATVSSVGLSGSMPAATAGTRTINGAGGYGSNFEYHGNGYCWPGMSPDGQLAYSSIKVAASFTGTGNGGVQNQTVQVPVYRGNPATEVFIQAGYSGGVFSFIAVTNGSYCDIEWTGVDGYVNTTAWKEPAEACNSSFVVSVTLAPNNATALYSYDGPAMPDVAISGPESDVSTAQYTVANTVGAVTWTNSSGSISDSGLAVFTGCGVAVITATDACGRSASKEIRLISGYWQLQSSIYNYANCNGTYNATYISGGTKIFMLFYATCSCIKSMNNYSWCDRETPIESANPPPFIPPDYVGVCTASAAPYGGAYYTYYGYWVLTACHVATYSWVCP